MTIKKIEKLFAVTLAFLCTGLAGWLYVVTREEDGTVVYRERLVTEEKAELPAVYDLREQKKAPAVKNQGELSTCWAVAASSALESALLPRKKRYLRQITCLYRIPFHGNRAMGEIIRW